MHEQTPQKYNQAGIRGTWVQTERSGHEAWAQLTHDAPKAAQLLHVLVAHMDEKAALVASQTLLAELCGVSVMTIRRAVDVLVKQNFIQTVRIGSERGGVLAYVVNARVAWADSRDNLKYAAFSARVIASPAEQSAPLEGPPLRQMPIMSPDDTQLPAGEGLPPPKQEVIEELLPDLPSIRSGSTSENRGGDQLQLIE